MFEIKQCENAIGTCFDIFKSSQVQSQSTLFFVRNPLLSVCTKVCKKVCTKVCTKGLLTKYQRCLNVVLCHLCQLSHVLSPLCVPALSLFVMSILLLVIRSVSLWNLLGVPLYRLCPLQLGPFLFCTLVIVSCQYEKTSRDPNAKKLSRPWIRVVSLSFHENLRCF